MCARAPNMEVVFWSSFQTGWLGCSLGVKCLRGNVVIIIAIAFVGTALIAVQL